MTELIDVHIAKISRASSPIFKPVFKLGGSPVFVAPMALPICRNCGKTMDFLAQIPLDAPILSSRKFKMAYVFMCPGSFDDRGWLMCETWRPFSSANALLLQKDTGSTSMPDGSARYPDYSVALAISREPNVDASDYSVDENLAEQVSGQTKVGGAPCWIQTNETPPCPVCGIPMRFIAQIDAALDGPLPADPTHWERYRFFKFGDAGLGYVFVCANDCSETGAFLWQS